VHARLALPRGQAATSGRSSRRPAQGAAVCSMQSQVRGLQLGVRHAAACAKSSCMRLKRTSLAHLQVARDRGREVHNTALHRLARGTAVIPLRQDTAVLRSVGVHIHERRHASLRVRRATTRRPIRRQGCARLLFAPWSGHLKNWEHTASGDARNSVEKVSSLCEGGECQKLMSSSLAQLMQLSRSLGCAACKSPAHPPGSRRRCLAAA